MLLDHQQHLTNMQEYFLHIVFSVSFLSQTHFTNLLILECPQTQLLDVSNISTPLLLKVQAMEPAVLTSVRNLL